MGPYVRVTTWRCYSARKMDKVKTDGQGGRLRGGKTDRQRGRKTDKSRGEQRAEMGADRGADIRAERGAGRRMADRQTAGT